MEYYYAVKRGKRKGVFKSLSACMDQVKGFPDAVFKRCDTAEEAEEFIYENPVTALKKTDCTAYVGGTYNPLSQAYIAAVLFKVDDKTENIYKLFNTFETRDDNLFSDKDSDMFSVSEYEFSELTDCAGEVMATILAISYAISIRCKSITIFHTKACVGAWPLNIWSTDNLSSAIYKRYIDSVKSLIDIQFFKISSVDEREFVENMCKEAKKELNCH